jgi:hypothetical protein
MGEQREWTLGAHRLRLEPPDTLWVAYQGSISLEEVRLLVDCYRELGRSGPFFLVVDLREAGRVYSEIQRYFSEHADTAWVHANIFIGARLAHKASAKGIFLAAWLTGRSQTNELSKIHFVSTPDEASELVARLRARLDGKVA